MDIRLIYVLFLSVLFFQIASTVEVEEIRLAALGVTGAGKSTLCNIITGGHGFKVSGGSKSSTKTCQSANTVRHGQEIKIVDTPGFFDTEMKLKDLHERIIPFLGDTYPGPHAIIYVLTAGRYTPQDVAAIMSFIDMFGEDVLQFTVFVFTKLEYGTSEQEYMEDLQKELKAILEKCQWRYVFMPAPYKQSEITSALDKLFDIINNMISTNNNRYYTNDMYKAQQKILEKKLEEQRQRQIREKEKEIAQITKEVEGKYQQHIGELTTEIATANTDRKARDNDIVELRKQLEQLKADTALKEQRIAELSRYRGGGPMHYSTKTYNFYVRF